MRQRWLGATGRRVPEICVEGEDLELTGEELVLDGVDDLTALERAYREGRPVVVRTATAEQVRRALARPEVACALLPPSARALRDLDLTELTYG